jgi:tRNA-2-methylthio-N6-dimethylallyladenosine synthase
MPGRSLADPQDRPVAASPVAASPVAASTVPESTVPESTGPESTGPESTGPESTGPEAARSPGTYEIRTYGCQMNMHDSERLAGLLEEAGYRRAAAGDTPGVVVFNTCAVRENADNRLYGNLGQLLPVKNSHPGLQIAVGGCLAQKDRDLITARAPWVDVVFGTHNIASLPVLLERARVQREAQVEIVESLERFPSVLPARRESAYSAWVAISVGCNNTCTFCIVPSLRGREEDRRPGDVLAEIRALVADGAVEVTLLGQNVNSYGAAFGDRLAFGKLLRACGEIDGLERVRFTSPHPKDFTDDVIDAMAQTRNVMPQLHMPLQSGSDAVLRAMRRAYRRDKYLAILDKVRAAIPEAAITTDIIVGFPGETESDFADTLDLVRRARFSGAFTFRYSARPGTPAATMGGQVPAEVVQERYERLIALVEQTSLDGNRPFVGHEVEVLVADGEGRKDDVTHRMSGRARDNRLVHFAPAASSGGSGGSSLRGSAAGSSGGSSPRDSRRPRPGDVVTTVVTRAAPHYLIADGEPVAVRRTRGGDAWAARRESHDHHEADGGPAARPRGEVLLGMPALRRPA